MEFNIIEAIDKLYDDANLNALLPKISDNGKMRLRKAFYIIFMVSYYRYGYGEMSNMVNNFFKYKDIIFKYINSSKKAADTFSIITSSSSSRIVMYLLGLAEGIDFYLKNVGDIGV